MRRVFYYEDRRKILKLSPSYMADLAVLVSTEDVPIVKTKEDFKNYFQDATAITIPGTLMEKDLIDLSSTEKVPFKTEFVSNSFGFLSAIKDSKKAFGYLSRPVYLMNLGSGIANVAHLKQSAQNLDAIIRSVMDSIENANTPSLINEVEE